MPGSSSASPSLPGRDESRTWAQIAVVCGVIAVATYALISAAPLSLAPALIVVCLFGPAFAAASAGLYHFMALHRPTVSLRIGLAANFAAGIIITMTLLGQLAFKEWLEIKFPSGSTAGPASVAYQAANGLQLGFDVAWDLFLAIGMILIAGNMWNHPRFGRAWVVVGGLIAVMLLSINLVAFPEPPGDSTLFDVGPLVGLWYLAVAIRIGSSLSWVEAQQA